MAAPFVVVGGQAEQRSSLFAEWNGDLNRLASGCPTWRCTEMPSRRYRACEGCPGRKVSSARKDHAFVELALVGGDVLATKLTVYAYLVTCLRAERAASAGFILSGLLNPPPASEGRPSWSLGPPSLVEGDGSQRDPAWMEHSYSITFGKHGTG